VQSQIDELRARIRALEADLEAEYRRARDEWARRKAELAEEFLRQQSRHRIGLLRYVARSRLSVIASAPLIYAGWIPFLLLDLFLTLFQRMCFPIYSIPRVKRSDFLAFDRAELPYLNAIKKFNCVYCSYANGIAAYAREVTGRTEQYWCPIKHARRMCSAHERYPGFFDHGDVEAYRQGLERLRRQLSD
jgi:hypothetical protein